MKAKLFQLFLIVCFLGIVVPAHAQQVATTGPFTFAVNFYHTVLKAVNVPLDIAEEYVAKPIIAADAWVDARNGEDPNAIAQAKLAKAAAKKAKAAAKKAPKGK